MLIREELLENAFGKAEPEHFRWQTQNPYISKSERELVNAAFLPLGSKVLDLGCGEGATLYHLKPNHKVTGLDLFEKKIAFARLHVPSCEFVSGSAYELPFNNESFDQILIRDVIHHVDDVSLLIKECTRVLLPGGRIDVLEPCTYNPLIFLHAITNQAERGELRSTPSFLKSLFNHNYRIEMLQRFQPLPVHRFLFHPKLGRPDLAHYPLVSKVVRRFEFVAGKIIPSFFWAYIHLRVVRSV